MKFQNPSLNFFFERTDERTHTHGQAESNMLPTFSKLGGIKSRFSDDAAHMVFTYLINLQLTFGIWESSVNSTQ